MNQDLRLYNTLGRKKELFKPIKKGNVSFYHCGPTVYWVQHIGNMRGMTMADLVRRTFEYFDYNVTMVRNYTDVGHLTSDSDEGDDKMSKGAKREGLTPEELANKYIERFDQDVLSLNLLEPHYKPRATQYIQEMIGAVEVMIQKNYAYLTPDAVYFDVSKFENYTELSGQRLEDQESGAGKGLISDPNKRNSRDFSVWFFKTGVHENSLQFWKSPFESQKVQQGEGFPGWHLECSVMSSSLLGETIDVHMGGIEHIPVHHTNEIAQSESVSGKKFVNFWIHNEHLLVDGSKMSKSEGTAYSVDDIVKRGFDSLDLRYLFLLSHYRSKQNFTWDSLSAARNARMKLVNVVRNLFRESSVELVVDKKWKERFVSKLAEDINVPAALAVVWEMLKSNNSNESKLGTLLDFDLILGLGLDNLKQQAVLTIDASEIESLIEKRKLAKDNKDFVLADKIRLSLLEKGVVLEDSAKETLWKLK